MRTLLRFFQGALAKQLVSKCTPAERGKDERRRMEDHVQVLGEVIVPRGKQRCSIEGRDARVTFNKFRRFRDEFHDGGVMAHCGLVNLLEQKIRKSRTTQRPEEKQG